MFQFGRASWELRVTGGTALDALLYIRDALRVPAASDTDPPVWPTPVAAAWPAASGDGQSPVLRARARALVAREATVQAWSDWWREVVARQLTLKSVDLRGCPLAPAWARDAPPVVLREPTSLVDHTPEARRQRFEPLLQRFEAFVVRDHGSEPGLAAVRDPVLRRAAHALWPAARAWAEQQEAAWHGDPETWEQEPTAAVPADAVPHALVERTAHDVAFDAGVPLERLRAQLIVVECPGPWSQQWAPGVLLCSRADMGDPSTAGPLLYAAFRSGVDA